VTDKLAEYRTIRYTRRGRILTLVLNRPDRMNAVDAVMHEELSRVFEDADDDAGSDVIILTGAGKAFSSGGDFAWMQAMIDDPSEYDKTIKEAKRIVFSLIACEKPVVAKLNGHATGLGATLALFSDVVFAAETAKIADPHVLAGFTAGDGGAVIWPELIGYARAKEYLLTGDAIMATEAAKIGLINHAVPLADLDARVDQFTDRLAAGAQQAIRSTKVSVNIGLFHLAQSMLHASLNYEALSNRSKDHQEAVTAFMEKRKPQFRGN
jgi:enoyl-CoA hydratase